MTLVRAIRACLLQLREIADGCDHLLAEASSGDVATLTRVRAKYGHGTRAWWTSGCRCPACRKAHTALTAARRDNLNTAQRCLREGLRVQ